MGNVFLTFATEVKETEEAKILLYKRLLSLPDALLSESDVEIMYLLSKDEAIQNKLNEGRISK